MWSRPEAPSSLQQTLRLQQVQWVDAASVFLVVVALLGSYLFCFFYRRCCLRKWRHSEIMNTIPSAAIMVSDSEEPLLGSPSYDEIEPVSLAYEYQPSAPPLSWENEHMVLPGDKPATLFEMYE